MSQRMIVGLLAMLGLVAGAWFGYDQWLRGAPVETVRAGYGPIQEFIDEQGKTRLPQTHLITMPFEGRILSIDLEEGAPVQQGQVVAQIAPADLDAQLAEATAVVERLDAAIRENEDRSVELTVLEQARQYVESMDRTVEAAREQVRAGEAKLDFANINVRRYRELRRRNSVSQEDLDRIETEQVQAAVEYRQDVLIARAIEALHAATVLLPTVVQQYTDRKDLRGAVLAKEQAEAAARLDQVKLNRQRGTMTSPVDGVVLSREVTNERFLTAGMVLLEIGRLEDLEVEADILSQDAARIAPGQAAEIHGPALGRFRLHATVRRVDPSGFTKVSSLGVEQQRVKVVLTLDEADLARALASQRLGVGYQVRVRIITASKSRTLLIPRSALFRSVAGAWQTFVVDGQRARLRTIQVGLINDELVEVETGLSEGDLVVLAPEADLRDGAPVRPTVHRFEALLEPGASEGTLERP